MELALVPPSEKFDVANIIGLEHSVFRQVCKGFDIFFLSQTKQA